MTVQVRMDVGFYFFVLGIGPTEMVGVWNDDRESGGNETKK